MLSGLCISNFLRLLAVGIFPRDLLSGENESDKLARLAGAAGPRDLWRPMEDRAAVAGNSLYIRACIDVEVGDYFLQLWFQGVRLELMWCWRISFRCLTSRSWPLPS